MLLDSNIIIYAAQPEHQQLRDLVAAKSPAVSAISYVEVLGYHRLTEADRKTLQQFFEAAVVLPLTQPVLDHAVALRQQRKLSLGDALIAGTAIAHDLTLVTRNVADFQWIAGLRLLNPLEPS